MKQDGLWACDKHGGSAAFGRLRVETIVTERNVGFNATQPPSGGCVLKRAKIEQMGRQGMSAAFGRLRVETARFYRRLAALTLSRLRAAAC